MRASKIPAPPASGLRLVEPKAKKPATAKVMAQTKKARKPRAASAPYTAPRSTSTGRSIQIYGRRWELQLNAGGYVISPIEIEDRRTDATHLAGSEEIFLWAGHRNRYVSIKLDEREAVILIAELEAAVAHARELRAQRRTRKKVA